MAAPGTPDWVRAAVAGLGARGVLVGPGGHGKTGVLDLVADGHDGPVWRVRGRRLEQGEPLAALEALIGGAANEAGARSAVLAALGDDGLLVVDDAQWLDEASLRVLVGVADRRTDGVVAAHRPGGGLAELDRVLGPPTVIAPLDEDTGSDHLAVLLGAAVEPALVDAVLTRTEGVPALVDALATGWEEDRRLDRGRLTGAADPPPPATIAAIGARLDQLGPDPAALTAALALGAVLDDALLADVAGLDGGAAAGARTDLRAAGLLVPGHDDLIEVVAAVVAARAPAADLRARHAVVVTALQARGVPAPTVAAHVVAADLGDPAAAATLVAAAEATLLEDPEQADEWLARAAAAGADRAVVAAPAAVTAFLTGRPDEALVAADDIPEEAAPEATSTARRVRASVLAGRGLWARAAADFTQGDDVERAALAAVAEVASGDRAAAARRLDGVMSGGTLAEDAALTAARSLLTAVGPGPDLALTGFADAAELAERRPLGPVPITPHALGVVVATAAGELTVARDLADRARRHTVGGPAHDRRHQLLEGWVALREGRWDRVEAVLAEPGPSDEATPLAVLAAALDVGLARRAGDLPRLMATWDAVEPLLWRQPVSPFAVEPTAELVIGAHRLGAADRVAPIVAELEAMSADLPLWALVLDWLLLQAAVAADDGEEVARRARAVGARPAPGPRLAALAPAAAAWLAVLGGEVHEDQVGDAADGLIEAGLVWEASRVVGQAAIRTTDSALARALLERARDVKGLLPAEAGDTPSGAAAPSVLSEREQEIGALVLDGLTHKEIGAQLYIAPKTVEHHVAKIRQKLGATTRAEMLAALRGAGP